MNHPNKDGEETLQQQDAEKKSVENTEQPLQEASEQPVAEEQPQDPADIEKNKIAELENQIKEANDKYLRLYSEFDNYRKRTAKERTDLIKSGGEDVFKVFLPVIDDFERALKSHQNDKDQTFAEGLKLIYNKLKNTLTQKGLEEMKTIGEPFNTDLHEAITNIPAPSDDMKGKIVEEMEKGYLLNGKVIRFAKVIIGN